MPYPAPENDFLAAHAALLVQSYRRLLRRELIPDSLPDHSISYQLFHAPFAVLSHNTADEPVFNYANLAAMELFGYGFDEITAIPSRLSAEPVTQAERNAMLAKVAKFGYIDDYSGVRIAKNGRRFRINNAVVWNLLDPADVYQGQAACITDWVFLPAGK
ncbi:MAG: MEKHLA domain-containing protein [Methylobacter sp.]|nr:MAG: MEKHLA domain-containing protein [Methylobacter sp.]